MTSSLKCLTSYIKKIQNKRRFYWFSREQYTDECHLIIRRIIKPGGTEVKSADTVRTISKTYVTIFLDQKNIPIHESCQNTHVHNCFLQSQFSGPPLFCMLLSRTKKNILIIFQMLVEGNRVTQDTFLKSQGKFFFCRFYVPFFTYF